VIVFILQKEGNIEHKTDCVHLKNYYFM